MIKVEIDHLIAEEIAKLAQEDVEEIFSQAEIWLDDPAARPEYFEGVKKTIKDDNQGVWTIDNFDYDE